MSRRSIGPSTVWGQRARCGGRGRGYGTASATAALESVASPQPGLPRERRPGSPTPPLPARSPVQTLRPARYVDRDGQVLPRRHPCPSVPMQPVSTPREQPAIPDRPGSPDPAQHLDRSHATPAHRRGFSRPARRDGAPRRRFAGGINRSSTMQERTACRWGTDAPRVPQGRRTS